MHRHSPLRHYVLFLLVLLIVVSACGTAPTPNKQPAAKGCAPTGKTSTITSTSASQSVQGEWPMFHGNLSRDGAASSGGSKLTLAWTYCTRKPVFSSPIVHNGLVYVASTDKTLTALNIHDGHVIWTFLADSVFYSTPILQNETVYAASLDGSLYALDAKTGSMRWHVQVNIAGAKLWSSLAVANGLVIVGVASALSEKPRSVGQLLAFDTRTGKQLWSHFTLAGGTPGGGIWSSPAIDTTRGVVYVGIGDPDDGVEALALQDGHLLWHWRSVVRDVADTDVGAGPTLYHDRQGKLRVTVGGKDGFIYSLDASNGRVLWHTHVGNQIYSSPAVAHGDLYAVAVISKGSVAWELDAETGTPHWQHTIPVIVYASPAIVGQTLYLAIGNGFGPGDGGVEVLDTTHGQMLQFVNLHSPTTSSPAVIASWLFVGSHDGNLYAFTR